MSWTFAKVWTRVTFTTVLVTRRWLITSHFPAFGPSASCHYLTSSASFATHILPFPTVIRCCHLPFPFAFFHCLPRLPLPLPLSLLASCHLLHQALCSPCISCHAVAICHCCCHLMFAIAIAIAICCCCLPLPLLFAVAVAIAICCYSSPLPFFRLPPAILSHLMLFLRPAITHSQRAGRPVPRLLQEAHQHTDCKPSLQGTVLC